jgi:hypothetical protein
LGDAGYLAVTETRQITRFDKAETWRWDIKSTK